TLATPELDEAVVTSEGITITWEEVEGAAKYNIYRKTEGSGWSKTFFTTKETEYTDTDDLTVGTEYFYTVRAVNGDYLSGYDKAGVSAVAAPAQPKLNELESLSETSLKVSWEEVENVDYYLVYKMNSEGKWKRISKKVTDTFFVDENAEKGKKQTYTVVSCMLIDEVDEIRSAYDEEVSGKTLTAKQASKKFASPKLRKAKGVASDTVKVLWKAAKNAEGYNIYRKKASGGWKQIGTVQGADKLEYLDTACKYGRNYTYTVRAYRKYGSTTILSGKYDKKGVTGTPILSVPVLKGAEPVDGRSGIKVSWETVKGATGYRVYRKEEGGKKWSLLKTVDKVTEYTDKTVKANTTYYYTVRAIVTVNKKTKSSKYDKTGVKGSTKINSKTVDGLTLYYDDNGNLIKDTESIIGKQGSYALEVDYDKNIVTVYAKGSGGSYNVPVKAFVCSTGTATPIGTFNTPAKYRWRTLKGPCYGQWCTRITGSILFHSVPYHHEDNNTLKVTQYNKLGTKCSAGCVRLCCRDAKWIYDNCRIGTRVTIKRNCKNPFGKPSALKISGGHTWDPTDPNMIYKCRQKGCH
ncbi:MAG: fibronectin type III domain-containing protein, partial [Oscillospiraceae bacterium]|nr:fibronectin type III domain-containing protein [Oscillospiraceae bacterium]